MDGFSRFTSATSTDLRDPCLPINEASFPRLQWAMMIHGMHWVGRHGIIRWVCFGPMTENFFLSQFRTFISKTYSRQPYFYSQEAACDRPPWKQGQLFGQFQPMQSERHDASTIRHHSQNVRARDIQAADQPPTGPTGIKKTRTRQIMNHRVRLLGSTIQKCPIQFAARIGIRLYRLSLRPPSVVGEYQAANLAISSCFNSISAVVVVT